MVVPFVLLLSTTEMNDSAVKLKKKRLIKHVVTLSVITSILFALIIVAGIILIFKLPPNNQKFTLSTIDLSQDQENWKHQVNAVFAINLIGPKEMRPKRSVENIKKYTLQVIRSLLFTYYGSDAQFVIQTYSIPGQTTFSEFCNAPCTMRYIDQIDQINQIDREQTSIGENPNQTDAVWQYYRYSLGRKPSRYILFVADRTSYSDDAIFEKDMEETSKILEQTKLTNKTETIFINNANIANYFMHKSNIISNGRSATELANLINNRLISYYNNDNKLNANTTIATTISDSSEFVIPFITETTTTTIITAEKNKNEIDVQTIPVQELPQSNVAFHNTEIKEQATTVSFISSTTKFSKTTKNDHQFINDNSRLSFPEDDFIVERMKIFSTDTDDANIESTTFTLLPFLWTGNGDDFEQPDDTDIDEMIETAQSKITSTEKITQSISSNVANELTHIKSTDSSSDKHLDYHLLTDKIDNSKVNLPMTSSSNNKMSSKFQANDRFEQTKLIENDESSEEEEEEGGGGGGDGTINFKSISDMNSWMDNYQNLTTTTTTTTTTNLSDVTLDDINTSFTDENAKFLLETIFSKVTPIDDKMITATDATATATDKLSTNEMNDKNVSEFVDKNGVTNLETLTQSKIVPSLDINDFAYFLEDLTISSTSTTFDELINLNSQQKHSNSFQLNEKFETTKIAEKGNAEITGIKEAETELNRGEIITEPLKNMITPHTDDILDIPVENSNTMEMDSVTTILEVPQISSGQSTFPESSFIQEKIHSSESDDKVMEQLASGKSNSFPTTEFSTILTNNSPENVMDLTGSVTDTSLLSDDKKLSMTTSKLLITDDFSPFDEISEIMKGTDDSSQFTNSHPDKPDLSIAQTTNDSSDKPIVIGFIPEEDDELIIDDSLSLLTSATTASTNDNNFAIKPQSILNPEIPDSNHQTVDSTTTTSNLSINNWLTFFETSTITPEIAIDMKNEVNNDAKVANSEISITPIPMTIFNITMRPSKFNAKHLNRSSNNNNNTYTYLILDEVSYTKLNESNMYDSSSTITSNIDDQNISLNDLLYDENEIYNDLYTDDSLSSTTTTTTTNDMTIPPGAKFTMESLSLQKMHQIRSEPEMATTSILHTVNNQIKNANEHDNSLISIDNPSVSSYDDTEELIEETDPENRNTENAITTTPTTISQIINSRKSDITRRTLDENLNDQITIGTTSIPEIEEIADKNMNHKKIIHQTLTVLKTENAISDDSSLSTISPSVSTSISFEQAMNELLSSDSNFLHKLNTLNLQSQINATTTTTTASDTDKELISSTDKNDNIFNTIALQSSPSSIIAKTENLIFQQKFKTGRNDITSVNNPILDNDDENLRSNAEISTIDKFSSDESISDDNTFINDDHTVSNSISLSVTTIVPENLIRNSFANDENLRSNAEISTIDKFSSDESISDDNTFINDDHTISLPVTTIVPENLIRNSFANDENLRSNAEISTIDKFSSDESISDDNTFINDDHTVPNSMSLSVTTIVPENLIRNSFANDENLRSNAEISTIDKFSSDENINDDHTNSKNIRSSEISINDDLSPAESNTDDFTIDEKAQLSGISTNNNFSPDWTHIDYSEINTENLRSSGISTNNKFLLNENVTDDLSNEERSIQSSLETSTNNNFLFDKNN
ncbi:hypothetical protein QQG55_51870 [Brugia pahangi]